MANDQVTAVPFLPLSANICCNEYYGFASTMYVPRLYVCQPMLFASQGTMRAVLETQDQNRHDFPSAGMYPE